MAELTNLQVFMQQMPEATRERLIYAATAYMDSCGLMTCDKENAERILALKSTPNGWVVWDSDADRPEFKDPDGLGCAITGKLGTCAVRLTRAKTHVLLVLYAGGRLVCECRLPTDGGKASTRQWFCGRVKSCRFCECFSPSVTRKQWQELLCRAYASPEEAIETIRGLLGMDETAGSGFASRSPECEQQCVYLYFCPSNVVKQRWGVFRGLPTRARPVTLICPKIRRESGRR